MPYTNIYYKLYLVILTIKLIVYDIIYQPTYTLLLNFSKELGLKTLNGLEMNFEKITPHTAKNLANCKASLTLIPTNGSFTNNDLAKALLKRKNNLHIDGVHYISTEVRDIISKLGSNIFHNWDELAG